MIVFFYSFWFPFRLALIILTYCPVFGVHYKKAVSDSENKDIAGYRSAEMKRRYDVKIHTMKPVR